MSRSRFKMQMTDYIHLLSPVPYFSCFIYLFIHFLCWQAGHTMVSFMPLILPPQRAPDPPGHRGPLIHPHQTQPSTQGRPARPGMLPGGQRHEQFVLGKNAPDYLLTDIHETGLPVGCQQAGSDSNTMFPETHIIHRHNPMDVAI
jgi:hypothetical protein